MILSTRGNFVLGDGLTFDMLRVNIEPILGRWFTEAPLNARRAPRDRAPRMVSTGPALAIASARPLRRVRTRARNCEYNTT